MTVSKLIFDRQVGFPIDMQETRPQEHVPAPTTLKFADSMRLHGLDALRAVAMFLGVVLHACICYMQEPMPGLLWTARDKAATSSVFDSLFWGIHGFRMPLFFLIAGFFSARLIAMRGSVGFLAHRRGRIGIPFVVGTVVILPLVFYCCSYGWLVAGECTFREMQMVKFQADRIERNLWGLGHLWFLEYLILYSLLLAAVVHAPRFLSPLVRLLSRLVDAVLRSPARWPLLAVPPAALLWMNPLTVLGFHQSLIPDPLQWAYYGVFFIYGNRLYRFEDWNPVERCSTKCLVCASLLGAAMLWMIRMPASGPMLAVTISLFACIASMGTWGLFLKLFSKQRPAMRYMADASYWVYLTSPPLIVLIQVNLMRVGGPAGLKFVTTIVLTTAICLATYHLFVRYSLLGNILHGRRIQEHPAPDRSQPADPGIARRAA